MATRTIDGPAVRDIRLRRGLKQRELADAAGVTRPYLSKVERGLKQPSAEVAEGIATCLGVDLGLITIRTASQGSTDEQ